MEIQMNVTFLRGKAPLPGADSPYQGEMSRRDKRGRDAVKRFESRYTPIPAEYRWLLLNFGGCYLAEPWIFTLKELEEAYPIFQEAYEDYMSEYDHGPTFPIGGLGDGSIVFIDLESGRVRGYNCDYADLEEIAENFSSLLLDLVEQALELGKLCREL